MPTPDNRRHHYVPQFYLKSFARPDAPGQLEVLTLDPVRVIPRASIATQAQRPGFYQTQEREQSLHALETDCSPIIKAAIERGRLPDPNSEEHHKLLLFVLFQEFRTPSAVADINQSTTELTRRVVAAHPTLPPELRTATFNWEDPVAELLTSVMQNHYLALDLWMKLLVNDSAVPLITSDSPVILQNQFMVRRGRRRGVLGLALKGLQIFLPLSPRTCLVLYDSAVYRVGGRTRRGQQVQISAPSTKLLNLRQLINADNLVFGNGALGETNLRRMALQARRWRVQPQTGVSEHPLPDTPEGGRQGLLHSWKQQVGPDTDIAEIRELPSASTYDISGRRAHYREPEIHRFHRRFCEAVERGEYEPWQFKRFVDDSFGPETEPNR